MDTAESYLSVSVFTVRFASRRDLSRLLYVSFADASAAFSDARGTLISMVVDFAFVVIGVFLTPAKALGAATTVVSDLVDFDGNTPGENIVVDGVGTAALATKISLSRAEIKGTAAMVAAAKCGKDDDPCLPLQIVDNVVIIFVVIVLI